MGAGRELSSMARHTRLSREIRVEQVEETIECKKCKSNIEPSSLCIYKAEVGYNENAEYPYHLDCYMKTYNWEKNKIPCCSSELKGLESIPLSKQKDVQQLFWPNQIEKSLRLKSKLPTYFIDDMNEQEMKLEVEKRDLKTIGIQPHAVSQRRIPFDRAQLCKVLEKYLIDEENKYIYDLIVYGYCRDIAESNALNIPQYLRSIVLKYYPIVLRRNSSLKSNYDCIHCNCCTELRMR